MRWWDNIIDSVDMSEQTQGHSEGQGSLAYARSQRVGQDLATEQQMVYPSMLNIEFPVLYNGISLLILPICMIVCILILTPSPRVSCFSLDREDVLGTEASTLPCSRLHPSKDDRCVGQRQQPP